MKAAVHLQPEKWRSLTAERLFDHEPYSEARSAKTEPGARVRVTAGHLGWAEVVFVMERRQADRIWDKLAETLAGKLWWFCAFRMSTSSGAASWWSCCGRT